MAIPNPAEVFRKPRLDGNNFIGTVVDVLDPKKQQRVKIRIPQLHRNIPDDMLPWSKPSSSSGGANSGAGVGYVRVPPKGAKLYTSMDANDPHSLSYGGSPTIDSAHKDNEILNEDYPHAFGEIDHAGNKTVTNTQRNTKIFIHKSGTTVHIAADGSVSVSSAKDVNVSSQNINVSASDKINIHAAGVLSLKGSQIQLNGSDPSLTSTAIVARSRPEIADPAGNVGY